VETRLSKSTVVTGAYTLEDSVDGYSNRANLGLNTRLPLGRLWTASLFGERVATIQGDPAADFTSLGVGFEYLPDGVKFSGRYETRFGELDTTHLLTAAGALKLGPRYTLLRREFVNAERIRDTSDGARRLLLTFGGADELNCAGAIATALLEAGTDIELRILVGPVNAHQSSLDRLRDRHDNLELRIAPRNVAAEIAWADLVISAAGSTALELAALGIPALLVAVAANQKPLGRALATAGAAVYLGAWSGLTSPQVAARGLDLVSDQPRLRGLREMGPQIVDGQGSRRVCAALAAGT